MTAVGEELEEFLANFCAFHNLYLLACVIGLFNQLIAGARPA
jgi:hypothetical protein